jgi:chemotaxis family two-component system response regulator Rcp1
MEKGEMMKPEILLVEDDPGDVDLTREALGRQGAPVRLAVVNDGAQAMSYLRRQSPYESSARPDLIILDLNLPRKDGRQVLEEIKKDEGLKTIPVIVLTTSQSDSDIKKAYLLGANCYIQKPLHLDQFMAVFRSINDFWLTVAKLPPSANP